MIAIPYNKLRKLLGQQAKLDHISIYSLQEENKENREGGWLLQNALYQCLATGFLVIPQRLYSKTLLLAVRLALFKY